MCAIRLDSDERRRAIVAAAVPLFARKGFTGTTTKEIADAAAVSEALLFKLFRTKAGLYQEIAQLGCRGEPELERLNGLLPSTATLVSMLRDIATHIVSPDPGLQAEAATRHHLMLNSLSEDGAYSRLFFERVNEAVLPAFLASYAAARAAGDLVESALDPENAFWFALSVAAMTAFSRLCGAPTIPYLGGLDAVVDQSIRFMLRGVGLTEAAIRTHYRPATVSVDAP